MSTTAAKEFQVYGYGICFASVCSSLPLEEVKARMRADDTGISSRWELSKDTEFATGQPHPCPCDANPSTHTHYLFSC